MENDMGKVGSGGRPGVRSTSLFDLSVGLLALCILGAAGMCWLSWSSLANGYFWGSPEMWFILMPLSGAAMMAHAIWEMGRDDAAMREGEFVGPPAPKEELAPGERTLFVGGGAIVLAWLWPALAIALPLGVMGIFGGRLPVGVATLLANAAAAAGLALGTFALRANQKAPQEASRALPSILLACVLVLATLPEFWTPEVWNCFPGISMVEPAMIR